MYRWIMVVLASIAMAATLPGRTHGLGLITERLISDFRLDRSRFADMNLVATLIGALFCWPMGWMIDRFGLRFSSTVILGLLGVVVVAMSYASTPIALFLLIILTRGLGQSALSVLSITMVAKWFQKNVSIAMGVYAVLMTILLAVATKTTGDLVITSNWRYAWYGIGMLICGCSFVMLLFARDNRDAPRDENAEHVTNATGFSVGQALSTSCFWAFSLSISFFGMVSAGISLFNQSILEERGYAEDVFHNVLVIGLAAGLIANLLTGFASQYFTLNKLLAGAMLMLGLTYLGFPLVKSTQHVYLYAVLNGAAGGMLMVLFFSVWRIAFGTKYIGQIQSLTQMMTVLGSAMGPKAVTTVANWTGSYSEFFYAAAATCFLFTVWALQVKIPCPTTYSAPTLPTYAFDNT